MPKIEIETINCNSMIEIERVTQREREGEL